MNDFDKQVGQSFAESIISKLSEEHAKIFNEIDNYLQLCRFGQELESLKKDPFKVLDNEKNLITRLNDIFKQIDTFIESKIAVPKKIKY